jgi:hypothetical protein
MSGTGCGGGSGTTRRELIASARAAIAAVAAVPVASADRSTRLTVSSIPASSPSRPAALANGTVAAARAVILASPGDIDAWPVPKLVVAGGQAVPAGGAVIPGPAQTHRADHGVRAYLEPVC